VLRQWHDQVRRKWQAPDWRVRRVFVLRWVDTTRKCLAP